jgi:TPR repeat protein
MYVPDHRTAGWRCALLVAAFALVGSAPAQEAPPAPAASATSDLVAKALAYEHGEGVPKNQRVAAELYCEAARGGDAEAMFSLGWMYANGRGVPHDEAIAASLFAQAARLGHAHAREMLRFVAEDEGIVLSCMLPPQPEPTQVQSDAPEDLLAELPPDKRRIAQMVVQAAPTYAVDPRLALAIVAVESNFQPDARSVKDARGVMQLISKTATRFSVRNRLDARDNISGGLAYLRWLLAYYQGAVPLAVAAYNAGEAAVDRYRGIPPYRETRDYVRRVLRLYPNERHPYDPSAVEPSPALGQAPQSSR